MCMMRYYLPNCHDSVNTSIGTLGDLCIYKTRFCKDAYTLLYNRFDAVYKHDKCIT